jgi:hypothetical protein
MPLTQVDQGLLSSTAQYTGFKNMLINGDMRVNQRGTVTGLGAGAQYGGPDRFSGQYGVLTTARYTASQDTSVPANSPFTTSLKWQVTTADTLAANDGKSICQVVEASNMTNLNWGYSNASSITLSFWVRTNVTGVYTVELYRSNTTAANASIIVNSADTWEFKTVTFAGPTSGTVTSSTSAEMYVALIVGAGSTYTRTSSTLLWGTPTNSNRILTGQVNLFSSTSNYINMTGVQLEKGSTATSFDYRPYGTELQLCQRYFYGWSGAGYQLGGFAGAAYSTSLQFVVGQFPVTMRSAPTLAAVTASNFQILPSLNTPGSITLQGADTQTFSLNIAASVSAGGNGVIIWPANSSARLSFSSEL